MYLSLSEKPQNKTVFDMNWTSRGLFPTRDGVSHVGMSVLEERKRSQKKTPPSRALVIAVDQEMNTQEGIINDRVKQELINQNMFHH